MCHPAGSRLGPAHRRRRRTVDEFRAQSTDVCVGRCLETLKLAAPGGHPTGVVAAYDVDDPRTVFRSRNVFFRSDHVWFTPKTLRNINEC